jgi:hypothetical protein
LELRVRAVTPALDTMRLDLSFVENCVHGRCADLSDKPCLDYRVAK